jgi:hypothetical protein
MFVTYRQQVDGHNWFPVYSRADDTLQFKSGAVHVQEVVKYANYTRADTKLARSPSAQR